MNTVSVVMATYNRASFIEEALDSAARQAVSPLEVIVIDDNSTDDTGERVARHPFRERIRYHRQERNQGASIARNLAAVMARGDVLVFLDSDDLLEPDHHARALQIMDADPRVALFCCDSTVVDTDGKALHGGLTWTAVQCRIKGYEIRSGRRSLADIFMFSTAFPGLSIRTSVYRELGGLDQDIFPLDDYDLQLKVAAAGYGVHYEHRALARYRVHGANESGAARAVKVGRQKLQCLETAVSRYTSLQALGGQVRRRRGEARRELALALLRDRQWREGLGALSRSLTEEPRGGVGDLVRIAGRKLWR